MFVYLCNYDYISTYYETVSIWSLFGPKKTVMIENVGGRRDNLFGREEQGGKRRLVRGEVAGREERDLTLKYRGQH